MTVPLTGPNGEPIAAVVLAVGDGTSTAPTVIVGSFGGTTLPVAAGAGLSATATETNVAASASSVTILAANASRKGAVIVNDSAAILYVRLSSTAASTTAYTYQMAGSTAGGVAQLEIPFGYTGAIRGIWASATGNARVTELT